MITKMKNKKGFTLVECVVAMAVISLITAAVIGIFKASFSLDTSVTELFYAKNIANSALKVFECSSNHDEFIGKLENSNNGIEGIVEKTSEGAEVTFDSKYRIDEIKAESTGGYFVTLLNANREVLKIAFENENDWLETIEYLKSSGKFSLNSEKYSFTQDEVSGGSGILTRYLKFKARFIRNFTVDYTANKIVTNELSNYAQAIGYSDDGGKSFGESADGISKDTKQYQLDKKEISHINGKNPKEEILNSFKSGKDAVIFNGIKVLLSIGFSNEAECDYQEASIKELYADFKCTGEKIILNKADFSTASGVNALNLYDDSNSIFLNAKSFKDFDAKKALVDSTSHAKSESNSYSFEKSIATSQKTVTDTALTGGKHSIKIGNVTLEFDNEKFNNFKSFVDGCTESKSYRTEKYGASGKDIQIEGPTYQYQYKIKVTDKYKNDKVYYFTTDSGFLKTSDGTDDSYFFSESEKDDFLSKYCYQKDGKYYYGFTSVAKESSSTGSSFNKKYRYYTKLTDKAGTTLYYYNAAITSSKEGYYQKESSRNTEYNLITSKKATYDRKTVYYPMEVTVEEAKEIEYYSVSYTGTYTYKDNRGRTQTAEAEFYFNGTNFDRNNPKDVTAAVKDEFLKNANVCYHLSQGVNISEKATLYPYSVFSNGYFDKKYEITVGSGRLDYPLESGSLNTSAASATKLTEYKKKYGNGLQANSTTFEPVSIYSKAVITATGLDFVNKLGDVIFSIGYTTDEVGMYLSNTNNHTKNGNEYIYSGTEKIELKVIYKYPYAIVVNADDDNEIIYRHELSKDEYMAVMEDGASAGESDEYFTSLTENLSIVPYISKNDGSVRYSIVVFTDFRNKKCVAFVVNGDYTSEEKSAVFNNLSVDSYSETVGDKKYVKGTGNTENKVRILYETLVYSKG